MTFKINIASVIASKAKQSHRTKLDRRDCFGRLRGLAMTAILAFLIPAFSFAKLKIVTSTPDIAWLVKELGGESVEVQSLLKGTENPHYADTVPEFIRLVAAADGVCIVGLELEIGWIPKVLSRSGNAQVQPGGKGYCEVGKQVEVMEKPTGTVDRSMGDVHPSGNPHFWTSPLRMSQGASEVYDLLIRLDPAQQPVYEKRLGELRARLKDLHAKLKSRLTKILGAQKTPPAIEYHKEFTYFLADFDIKSFGSLEEKPGVPPSAGRIAEVALAAKKTGVRFLLAANFSPQKTLDRFHELSHITILKQPVGLVLTSSRAEGLDYFVFQENLVASIEKVLSPPKVEQHGKTSRSS